MGKPHCLKTENAPTYTSSSFDKFCHQWNIILTCGISQNPTGGIQDGGLEGGCVPCCSITSFSGRGYLFLGEAVFAADRSPAVYPICLP